MKKLLILNFSFFIFHSAFASAFAACGCGVAPERENDFWWENDKFGMRAYGPGEFHKWSGLDIFNKMRGAASVGDLLRKRLGPVGNWHTTVTHGLLDNYTVGAGRGCGAVALWGDGEWKTYPDWETSEILVNTPEKVEFKLVYPAFSAMGKMTYHITLEQGKRFFKNEVTFEKNYRGGFAVGPGLDLEPARDHHGSVFEDEKLGIVSIFEDPKNDVEGSTATAIILDPKDAKDVAFKTDHMNCRVMTLKKNSFTYYAGCAWSKAGEITTAEQWKDCVLTFRKEIEK